MEEEEKEESTTSPDRRRYLEIQQTINKVGEVFINYFGEERVDIQIPNWEAYTGSVSRFFETHNITIVLYFPKITIENEHSESRELKKVWVKIPLTEHGTMLNSFKMTRSEYTYEEALAGYRHSHIYRVAASELKEFHPPCLGSGPLNDTTRTLRCRNEESFWLLFCVELEKFIKTESLTGGPYVRMSEVASSGGNNIISFQMRLEMGVFNFNKPLCSNHITQLFGNAPLKEFITYLLEHQDIPIVFRESMYVLGESLEEFLIKLSNTFIDWINTGTDCAVCVRAQMDGFLIKEVVYHNLTLVNNSSRTVNNDSSIMASVGTFVLEFKGKDILIEIDKEEEKSTELIKILKPEVGFSLLLYLLNSVNYNGNTNKGNTSYRSL